MNIFADKYKRQMATVNTYVQQLKYNGTTYTSGSVVDLLDKFNIICQDFPFKKFPETKDLPERDWPDEDGADVYIPDTIPMKAYTMDVDFLYVGTHQNIMTDISDFIGFLCGRVKGSSGDSVQSGRLAIYNEHTGIGRKDVYVTKVDNELFYDSDADPDAVAKFKVTFKVCDPVTDVSPTTSTSNGQTIVTGLSFS